MIITVCLPKRLISLMNELHSRHCQHEGLSCLVEQALGFSVFNPASRFNDVNLGAYDSQGLGYDVLNIELSSLSLELCKKLNDYCDIQDEIDPCLNHTVIHACQNYMEFVERVENESQ